MNTKKENRIARYDYLAQKYQELANAKSDSYYQEADLIPFGQPITSLRDRNRREKLRNRMLKAFELQNKANYYLDKANSARKNNAISSDDENAETLILDKIAKLEAQKELYKQANKYYKKHGDFKAYPELQKEYEHLQHINCWYSWSKFDTTSANAEIRRLNERLITIRRNKALEYQQVTDKLGKACLNPTANRVQIFFKEKPSYNTILSLKQNGFRWTPSIGAWQASLKQSYWDFARQVIKQEELKQ